MNPARLLMGFVLQMNAFAAGHHAVGLGASLDAIQVDLAGGEAAGLGAREFATRNALLDALALVLLARIDVRRTRRGDARESEGEGQADGAQGACFHPLISRCSMG